MLERTMYQFDSGNHHPTQRRLSWQQDDQTRDNSHSTGELRRFLDIESEAKLWKSLEDLTRSQSTETSSFKSLKVNRKCRGKRQQVEPEVFRFPSQEGTTSPSDQLKARSLVLTGKTRTVVAHRTQHHHHSNPHLCQQKTGLGNNSQCYPRNMQRYHSNPQLVNPPQAVQTIGDPYTPTFRQSINSNETPQLGPHKVILVGDSGVGKSSFMLRLCDDAFNEKMNPSFGLDFKTKVISVNGVEENIQIWDTAGQERFRSITQSYFRKVDGIILVYDITHEESFLNLQNWVTCIQESGQLSAPMTIIGNKLDLEHLRCVSREMATELANFYEADFVEVSAKDGRNINQLGYDLVSKLVERRALHSRQAPESSFPVTRPPTKEYSEASCCVIL